jgi:hypothetical protein
VRFLCSHLGHPIPSPALAAAAAAGRRQAPATIEIRRALKTLENAVTQYIHDADLAPAS